MEEREKCHSALSLCSPKMCQHLSRGGGVRGALGVVLLRVGTLNDPRPSGCLTPNKDRFIFRGKNPRSYWETFCLLGYYLCHSK